MKDIENADGTKEDKIKLIRSESIGNYAWDNKGTYGENDWSDSALQKVLNEGAYYNRTSGNCPGGQNGATKACDFSSTGLTNEAKSMISEVVWNLGGVDSTEKITKEFYKLERQTSTYAGRPTKWRGRVGLMYSSDYGYATSGGSTTDRSACLNTGLFYWKEDERSDCRINDWLRNNVYAYFTMTPLFSVSNSILVTGGMLGNMSNNYASNTEYFQPVIYLDSKLKIENGNNGSSTSPFVLK